MILDNIFFKHISFHMIAMVQPNNLQRLVNQAMYHTVVFILYEET